MTDKLTSFDLRKEIPREEFDYTLLTSKLAGYASIRRKINELLKQKIIIRVKKGLYIFSEKYQETLVCKETLANLIYGPSCISLEYALAFYQWIPERVETITSVTPKRNKEFHTPLGDFTYQYLVMKKYAEGIEQVWVDQRHTVLMASPEKALCDYVLMNKIPMLETKRDVMNFLLDDLRIERKKLKECDLKQLKKLSKIYQCDNITKIILILEKIMK